MMNIKMIWFYASLLASACGGAGIMGAVSPSQNDLAQAFRQAQLSCEPSAADRAYQSGVVNNSKAKNYTLH